MKNPFDNSDYSYCEDGLKVAVNDFMCGLNGNAFVFEDESECSKCLSYLEEKVLKIIVKEARGLKKQGEQENA